DLDAGRTPLLDQETTDAGIGQEGQVRAAARLRVEVGRGGRDAPVVEVVDGDREVTRSEVFVLVLDVGETGVEEGVGGGAGEGGPVVADDAPDRQRTIPTVHRPLEVEVTLQTTEKGQHAGPIPAIRPQGGPPVVVRRLTAVGHHPVDTRPAAHDACL